MKYTYFSSQGLIGLRRAARIPKGSAVPCVALSSILSMYLGDTVGKYEYRLRKFLKLGRRCIIVRGRN